MTSLVQDDTESQKAVCQDKKPTTKQSFKNVLLLDTSEKDKELLNLHGTRLLVEPTTLSLTHFVMN